VSSAKASAETILDELGINDPRLLKHLVEICIERGAYVRQANLVGADARLTVRGSTGIITVKPQPRYKTRTRFSVAHELGHFELHRRQSQSVSCAQEDMNDGIIIEKRRSREAEANDFAAELLLPERFIKPQIVRHEPSLEFVRELANQYDTSLFATMKRFIQLTPRECVAVFYDQNKIRYVWASRALSDYTLPWVKTLHPESSAYRSARGNFKTRDHLSADPLLWFRSPASSDQYSTQWRESVHFFSTLKMGVALLEKLSD